jgi:hypothetical protein
MTSLEIFPRKCVYMLWCFSDDFRKLFKIPSFRTGPKLRRREDQHPPNRDKESEFPELRKGARILSPFAILHIQPRRGRFAISWIFHAEIGHVFSFQEKG